MHSIYCMNDMLVALIIMYLNNYTFSFILAHCIQYNKISSLIYTDKTQKNSITSSFINMIRPLEKQMFYFLLKGPDTTTTVTTTSTFSRASTATSTSPTSATSSSIKSTISTTTSNPVTPTDEPGNNYLCII